MNTQFNCIGLIGVPRQPEALVTHEMLYNWLTKNSYHVLVEDKLKEHLSFPVTSYASLDEIGQHAQLAVVIGGDGNMLRAARYLSHYDIKIIGINRGNLGFLTDITPDKAIASLSDVLSGEYVDDPRFLLEVTLYNQHGESTISSFAVNEIVVHPDQVAHMIEYEAYINDKKAFAQRADGVIISTPTGSTAYSLSAGGPIITPDLDALIITPMFPHSLSARPLVIKSDNIIRLKFPKATKILQVACDSQIILAAQPTDEIVIKCAPYQFNLIHSTRYNYFRNLSTKLGWSKKLY
ncbi:NAD+ kinase [Orbus hercynius]|uniref:NAD kinase n=1 Tax=Orbus hercynius TaxID=593135 RepID=A0A495REH3_9GAMM|nr:NAD(+) kinase [Orbus hercynius]RKS85809.1 NAD+ kinase [Orbus hercynius]